MEDREAEEREEWSESDQAQIRKRLRGAIGTMPEEGEYGYDDRLVALVKLRHIVAEEIAAGFEDFVYHVIRNWRYDKKSDAQYIVDTLARDLAALRLAVKHPDNGQAMRLRMARTPPTQQNETWFELEPIVSGLSLRTTRLFIPIPRLKLCGDPMPSRPHEREAPGR